MECDIRLFDGEFFPVDTEIGFLVPALASRQPDQRLAVVCHDLPGRVLRSHLFARLKDRLQQPLDTFRRDTLPDLRQVGPNCAAASIDRVALRASSDLRTKEHSPASDGVTFFSQ